MERGRCGHRIWGALVACLSFAGLVACGSSGAVPQAPGIDPGAYMERFSGQWAFDADVSENPAEIIPPGTARGVRGDRPRGGGVGVPGRRGRRRRGPPRMGPDSAAMRTTFDTFRSVPDRFSLSVSESTVSTTWAGGRQLRIPVAGDEVEMEVNDHDVGVSAGWDGARLRIERDVPGGGTVVDLIEALPERPRLLVTRRIEGYGGMMAEVRLAFDRLGG